MNENTPIYFTVGEMASMFGISKQALLYYDKIGLLKPQFISSNGYRHYSMNQYLILEIIINMRNLNFSIEDIKNYIDNRDKDTFLNLLKKRAAVCEKVIKENERIKNSLNNVQSLIDINYQPQLDKITLIYKKRQSIRLTNISPQTTDKERIMLYAAHSQKTVHNNKGSIEKNLGWIIDAADFFSTQPTLIAKSLFSYSPNMPGHKNLQKDILSEGLYIELYFKGSIYKRISTLSGRIYDFIKLNDLKIQNEVFIYPIKNHWLTKDPDEYINQIFLPVV